MSHQMPFVYSDAHTTLLAGGWGSGKSVAGLGFIEHCMCRNDGTTGLIIMPTYKMAREYLQTHFRPAFGHMFTGQNLSNMEFYLPGNRRVIFLSADRPERIEMYTAAWAYIDEAGLISSAILPRISARLRDKRAGQIRLGLTGTPHWGWLKDAFEGKHDAQRAIYHARTIDNIHLADGYVDNLMANCPARMRAAYLEGQFIAPGGGVYPEWNPAVHIVDDVDIKTHGPSLTFPAIDWSPRTPHVLGCQLLHDGVTVRGQRLGRISTDHDYAGMLIYDEMIPDGSHQAWTTERLCHAINQRGYTAPWYVCDPAGLGTQDTSGTTQIQVATQVLGKQALYTTNPASRLIANGVDMVRRLLEPLSGPPRLYVSKALVDRAASFPTHLKARSIVNAIPGYSYPEIKDGKAADGSPIKDGVTDHACDCMRYAVIKFFPAQRLQARTHKAA